MAKGIMKCFILFRRLTYAPQRSNVRKVAIFGATFLSPVNVSMLNIQNFSNPPTQLFFLHIVVLRWFHGNPFYGPDISWSVPLRIHRRRVALRWWMIIFSQSMEKTIQKRSWKNYHRPLPAMLSMPAAIFSGHRSPSHHPLSERDLSKTWHCPKNPVTWQSFSSPRW